MPLADTSPQSRDLRLAGVTSGDHEMSVHFAWSAVSRRPKPINAASSSGTRRHFKKGKFMYASNMLASI